MASYKVEAFVLRSQPFAEADRLVTLLAEDGRRIRAVARGARRMKSRLAYAAQPFVRGSYLLWHGRSLDGISQAEVLASGRRLREDAECLAAAAYVSELAESFSEEEAPNPGLFGLLQGALMRIESGDPGLSEGTLSRERRDIILRAFEAGALAQAGYRPNLEACVVCGGALDDATAFSAAEGGAVCARCAAATGGSGLVPLGGEAMAVLRRWLAGDPLAAADRLRVSPVAAAELSRALGAQVAWILQTPPKSAAFLDMLSPAGPGRPAEGGRDRGGPG